MNEAELLFTHILNCNRLSLYLDKDLKLDKDKTYLVSEVLKRRIRGEPLPYILGRIEFMGLEFKLTPDVFIPRPVTEVLVETVLKIVRMLECSKVRMLDLGTGSGCIAVSLAKFLSNVRITATDISAEAIKIAQYNAALNKVADKIEFIQGDLFTPLESPIPLEKSFLTGFTNYDLRITDYDIIVTNPPYIPRPDIKNLQAEVRREPRVALDGGDDGLDFYRRIIRESSPYLKEDGFLIMEMGFGQYQCIKKIFDNFKNFQIREVVLDYDNTERVIVAKRKAGHG